MKMKQMTFLRPFFILGLLGMLLFPPMVRSETASPSPAIDRVEGHVWVTGGAWSADNNSSYGRSYRDLAAPVQISRLELRYFNDKRSEYHLEALDLGTLNSRYNGVLYLRDRFKLDFDGGRISHTMFKRQGFKTQRDWVALSALQDVHPFVTLGLSYDGYDRDGFHRYNLQDMSYSMIGFSANYLRGVHAGRIYYAQGEFRHPIMGYDESDFGFTLGRVFRADRDHALVSYERNDLENKATGNSDLENHFLSAVYTTNPHKYWTLRGAFRGTVRDNRTPSIYGLDFFDRTANLDVAYHGFKKVRAKARLAAHNVDRYARTGWSRLPDTEDLTTEIRLANKGKSDFNWDFRYTYTERDGGRFQHVNPSEHSLRTGASNLMDYFPGNSFKRSRGVLSGSKSFNKDKFLVSANLNRDWTNYSRNPATGVGDYRLDNAMINFLWLASEKLSLGLGAGGTVTELKAVTSAWYRWAQRTLEDSFVSRDDVYTFNLGYSFSSRTNFTADFLSTRGYSDGLVVPNRFGELDQQYDLEYRISRNARVGLRYADVHYVERIYGQENGRIRRWDLDYRILF